MLRRSSATDLPPGLTVIERHARLVGVDAGSLCLGLVSQAGGFDPRGEHDHERVAIRPPARFPGPSSPSRYLAERAGHPYDQCLHDLLGGWHAGSFFGCRVSDLKQTPGQLPRKHPTRFRFASGSLLSATESRRKRSGSG